MNAQKTIATIMILFGSVLTAWASRDIAFPAILCMFGLLGLQRRFTWDFRPERRFITSLLLLLLAILFAMHYQYAGAYGWGLNEQAAIVAWQTIARYFLASMILILFLGAPNCLPPSLGLFHVATVLSAGQVLLLEDMYAAFRVSELFAVVLVILYAAAAGQTRRVALAQRPGRGSGWATSGLILVLAGNFGWVTSSVLYRHVEAFNYLPVWLWHGGGTLDTSIGPVAGVGFSASGELGGVLSIKEDPDAAPVLRITCDTNPGYLRACAFEVYRESQWHDLSYREAIVPSQNTPFGAYLVGRTSFFRLREQEADETRHMGIRHESGIGDVMFTPLGTTTVEAPLSLLMHDDNEVVSPPTNSRVKLSYRVTFTDVPSGRTPSGQHSNRMLGVPAYLDPRIRQLADKIFAGRDTTAEKIDAVVDYFQANYTYSLGLDAPLDRDRLTYFLLEAKTGYCEYFASGAAILLRLAGVPSRYVTGFLVTEKDESGQTWLARNMDAHAWVEAWDRDRRRWTLVEATVQDGLGAAAADDASKDAEGAGGYLVIRQLMENLYQYGLFGVLAWLFEFYGLFAVSVALAAPLGGLSWWLWRHRWSNRRNLRTVAKDPALAALHRMLARMDRKAKAAGLRRELSETLHAFARRLRTHDADGALAQVSDWYLEYANVRYGKAISAQHIQRLEQLARRPGGQP